MPWRQLLHDEPAARVAAAVVDAVAEALSDPEAAQQDVSLAGGSAGLALFFSYLAAARDDERHRETSRRHLQRATAALATAHLRSDLFDGFPGVAWVIAHLQDDAGRSDPLATVDVALLGHLARRPTGGPFDLVGGLVGLGVYALERLPRPRATELLGCVLERLEESAERDGRLSAWISLQEWVPQQWRHLHPRLAYDLGVAHGAAGVIGFLTAVCASGVEEGRARDLLDATVGWTLAQRLDGSDSCFPARRVPGEQLVPTRSAWCYGDPGVATVLLAASRVARKDEWYAVALTAARRVAARPAPDTGVEDAGLCHGAAGLAHLLNRLHQSTGDASVGAAATHWVLRTLEICEHPGGTRGSAGEAGAPSATAWRREPGFLTGAAGTALALLAASSELEPAWDRVLLASHRVPPPVCAS